MNIYDALKECEHKKYCASCESCEDMRISELMDTNYCFKLKFRINVLWNRLKGFFVLLFVVGLAISVERDIRFDMLYSKISKKKAK